MLSLGIICSMNAMGNRIRELRIGKRMSQAELGDMLGVTRGAVYNWEKGLDIPKLQHISELSRIFGVSLATIMGMPDESDSVDKELRELPGEIQAILRESFLNTIRGMKPIRKTGT